MAVVCHAHQTHAGSHCIGAEAHPFALIPILLGQHRGGHKGSGGVAGGKRAAVGTVGAKHMQPFLHPVGNSCHECHREGIRHEHAPPRRPATHPRSLQTHHHHGGRILQIIISSVLVMRQIVGAQATEILVLLHGKQSSCHQRQSHAHHPIGARIGQEMLPVERISHFERVATRHHHIGQHHTLRQGIGRKERHNAVTFHGACQQGIGLSAAVCRDDIGLPPHAQATRWGRAGLLRYTQTVTSGVLSTPTRLVIAWQTSVTGLCRQGKQNEQRHKARSAHTAMRGARHIEYG